MADCSEKAQAVLDLAEAIVNQGGIETLDELVADMQTHIPLMTRDVLVDFIVEATATQRRETTELAKTLAEIKREARTDKSLKNLIAEIEGYLTSGTLPAKEKGKKDATDPIKILREMRDILKKKLKESKQWQDRATPEKIAKLREKIKVLQTHIDEGTLPITKPGTKVKDTNAIVLELKRHEKELKSMLGQTIPARIARTKEQIKFLEAKIKAGVVLPVSKSALETNKELMRLEFEKDLLKSKIRKELWKMKPRNLFQKIAVEPFQFARVMMTTGEFSLVARQGGWMLVSHPIRTLKAVPNMFKAFFSRQKAYEINKRIFERDNAPLYARAGLHISPIDGQVEMSRMEEIYMSRWTDQAWGIRQFNQAGLTFMNQVRAEAFDVLAWSLPMTDAGPANQKELKAIADYVNIATGRGNLGKFEGAAVAANTIFFAPKYTVSRFQLLMGTPMWQAGQARKLIAMEYARALIGISFFYSMAAMAGADIEWDPRSTDFLKIRIGKTHIDPMFGLNQPIVLISRLFSGSKKSGSGRVSDISGEDAGFGADAWDEMTRFLRKKLSPMAGTTVDMFVGEDLVGQPTRSLAYATRYFVPLSYRDIYEAMEEHGIPKGAALGMLTLWGVGMNTYDTKSGRNLGL